MTFAVRTFLGQVGKFGAFLADLRNTSVTAGTRTASITFNTDGSMSWTGTNTGTDDWWEPNQPGVGDRYYIKIVPTFNAGSTTYTNMAVNTWYALTVNRTFTVQNGSTSSEGIGSADVVISTAGSDATIVKTFSGGISWDVGYMA